MNFLDISVSCFKTAKSWESKPVKIGTWITSQRHRSKVDLIRSEPDKEVRDRVKLSLPCITPSGIFEGQRRATNLAKHSGLICIDLDNISDAEQAKRLLSQGEEFSPLYVGLSASGKGLWCLFRVSNPERHLDHFNALSEAIEQETGLKADPACSDVCRARFYSYDDSPYINTAAPTFRMLKAHKYVQVSKKEKEPVQQCTHLDNWTKEERKMDACVSEIERRRLDITQGYTNWLRIGFAISGEFGLNGKEFFHRVSQFHYRYDWEETEKQYDKCLSQQSKTPIGYFYRLCLREGIRYTDSPVFWSDMSESV